MDFWWIQFPPMTLSANTMNTCWLSWNRWANRPNVVKLPKMLHQSCSPRCSPRPTGQTSGRTPRMRRTQRTLKKPWIKRMERKSPVASSSLMLGASAESHVSFFTISTANDDAGLVVQKLTWLQLVHVLKKNLELQRSAQRMWRRMQRLPKAASSTSTKV